MLTSMTGFAARTGRADGFSWSWELRSVNGKGFDLRGRQLPCYNSGGIKRHYMRIRWWDSNATTYKKAFVGPPAALSHIEDDPIEGDHLIEYGHHEVPLFIGHYWMQGTPTPLTQNIACVDYSIARRDGKLCAYRWDGETDLDTKKYVCVSRLEP